VLHFEKIITTCPGVDTALEGRVRQAGKAGFGVLHPTQLIGHAARLLYLFFRFRFVFSFFSVSVVVNGIKLYPLTE